MFLSRPPPTHARRHRRSPSLWRAVVVKNESRRALEMFMRTVESGAVVETYGSCGVVVVDVASDTVIKMFADQEDRARTLAVLRALEPSVEVRFIFGPIACDIRGQPESVYGINRSYIPYKQSPRIPRSEVEMGEMVGALAELLCRMLRYRMFIQRDPFSLSYSVSCDMLHDFLTNVTYDPATKRMRIFSAGAVETRLTPTDSAAARIEVNRLLALYRRIFLVPELAGVMAREEERLRAEERARR